VALRGDPPIRAGRGRDHPFVRGPVAETRVLRGGSFNNNRDNARCAYRNRNDPDNDWNNNGFRIVVVSHVSLKGRRRKDEERITAGRKCLLAIGPEAEV